MVESHPKSRVPDPGRSKATRHDTLDLAVIVDFVFEQGLLFVKLQNITDKPARRVRVTFDQEILGLGGAKAISKMCLFRNIEFFAPGKQISAFVDTSESYFRRGQPTQISATVQYLDSEGKKHSGEIRHDLRIYADLGYVRPVETQ